MAPRSPAPKPRPRSKGKTPSAPPPRPKLEKTATPEEAAAIERGNRSQAREAQDYRDFGGGMKAGGKVKKMATGGKIRGCGAATKGTKFTRAG